MIETQVIQYLETKLNVPVYAEDPTEDVDEYIVIEMIDGGRIEHIDAVTFNIESISTSMLKAADLNERVRSTMFGIIEIPNISASRCGGGGQNIDRSKKAYRFECVFNLFYTEE